MIVHIFLDLNTNLVPFSVADTLDFVSFFAFKCNGTSLMAEMHREIMSDLTSYFGLYLESASMYSYLEAVNRLVSDKGIGVSTEPRFTYSGGSSDLDWSSVREELLALLNTFRQNFEASATTATLKKETSRLIKALLKSKNEDNQKIFKGCGPMGANHFVHMSALLGLLPLGAYLLAEIRSTDLGPGKILNDCYADGADANKMNARECTQVLHEVHKNFAAVWNDMPTVNFIENALCYCSRTYINTCHSLGKKMCPLTVIMDDSKRKESKTKNVYFMDVQRDHVQNFFLVRISGCSATTIKPVLVMKDASKWHLGDAANINLTNWQGDKSDRSLLRWNVQGTSLSLDTTLLVDKVLYDIYGL